MRPLPHKNCLSTTQVFGSAGNSSQRARATLLPWVWCYNNSFGCSNKAGKQCHCVYLVKESVEVGQEPVSVLKSPLGGSSQGIAKHSWILVSVAEAIVVAGEGIEGSQLLPPGAQLLSGVTNETTNICNV